MKKPSDRNRRALPITFGAVRRIGLGHPLRRDPARVIDTNMSIRNGQSKPDVSASRRIGHFYFAPTRSADRKRLCPNTLNFSFPGVDSTELQACIRDRVACSTGCGCHAGKTAPSATLLAIGRSEALATARSLDNPAVIAFAVLPKRAILPAAQVRVAIG